ncbi:unnamed protein product [Blepharisma stoltei]|uniref:Uncharacterized protein n=1 Tax=Blepharisma stoltei TaxID=1481888 RepID=A0AAU9J825_9CILI|nr:unnamed protein product [Blepharisma stoltei]
MKVFLPIRKKIFVPSEPSLENNSPQVETKKFTLFDRKTSKVHLPSINNREIKIMKSKHNEASTCTSTDISDDEDYVINLKENNKIIEQNSDLESSPPKKSVKKGLNFSILCENVSKLKTKCVKRYKKYRKEYPAALIKFAVIDTGDTKKYPRRLTPNPRFEYASNTSKKSIRSSSRLELSFNLSTRFYM